MTLMSPDRGRRTASTPPTPHVVRPAATDLEELVNNGPGLRIVAPTAVLDPLGGIELCLFEDTVALAGRGHTVDVLYAVDGSHRVEYERLGGRVVGPFDYRFAPRAALRDLVRFARDARVVRRAHGDVLWLSRPEHIVWAQTVARLSGLPLVVHLHHAPGYRRMRLLSTGVARFIAVSEYMKQLWVAVGVPADRITVLHNAIPTERYPFGGDAELVAARTALGLPQDVRVVTYYGRLTPSKGVGTILAAWKRHAPSPDDAVLVLAGDPEGDQPELTAAIDALPEGSVHLLPRMEDVVPLLHASDVVVAPSIEPESFGRVVVEAMSSGRPVVTSRHGGTAEILAGGLEHLLVEPTDEEELARVIGEVVHWRTTDPELGARCHAWVEERFPRDEHVDALERILRDAARRG